MLHWLVMKQLLIAVLGLSVTLGAQGKEEDRLRACATVLKEIINIQLHDNVKARSLNNELNNEHVHADGVRIRSQVETYNFLHSKIEEPIEISSD